MCWAALPADVLRRLADEADDMVDPQPDTAPDLPGVLTMLNARTRQQPGAWGAVIEAWGRDVSDTQLLTMARDALAAALNGAPATPAERAVIDAADVRELFDRFVESGMAEAEDGDLLDRLHGALLRAERNKP